MSRFSNAILYAGLSLLSCGIPASADSLRCQSVNGNVNCAGSGGASCQTINGKTVCISGHGDVMQSFGNGSSRDTSSAPADDPDTDLPAVKERLEQHGPGGHSMLLQRNGTELHLRTDWLSVDRE